MRKFLSILASIFLSLSVFAEAKNALLIANSNYTHFGNLSTPVKEARELKNSLTQIGFSVTIVENASREKILDSLSDFEKILKSKGGIAFFHYGGHAVQVNGRNYLIPVDADIPDERRVQSRAIDVDEIMVSMNADTNIVILDSCRNNPLPAASVRDGKRGLVMTTERPRNSIIVYSAQAGKTAQDGIFTPTLTKKILEKKSFTDILMDVRREVRSVTKNEQSPCEYNELEMPIFLAGNAGGGQNYVPQTSSASSDPKTADEYYNLGVVAFNEKNYTTAAEYYKKAILINEIHKEALNNLGYCYEKGFGVTQNYAKAEELYRKSANLGHVTAQNNLGNFYYYGKGVSQDYYEAKKWYLKAAEQGDAYAQYSVGWLFEYGQGVNKNINTALSYYQMAANQGNEDAKKRIAAINATSSNNTSVQTNGKWLFPVYGLELGKSTLADVRAKGKKVSNDKTGRRFYVNGHLFECNENGKLSWVHFFDPIPNPWPQEIINKGYNPNYSYNQWKSFLISQGYTITKYSDADHIVAEKNMPVFHKLRIYFNNGKTRNLIVVNY